MSVIFGDKRWLRLKVYARRPPGMRALLYFLYRYHLRLAFAFHFLQGFWYRFLVDVKVHELETLMRVQGLTLEEAIRREFGYKI